MTKVYLVEGSYWTGEKNTKIILAVYTNKKLANIYKEFKELSFEPSGLGCDRASYRVYEERISKLDWTEELLELQMKKLPY